jgi:death-on-curing protein
MTPRLLGTETINAIHAKCLDQFGGLPGTPDPGAVVSAVKMVQNHFDYTGSDLFNLAGVLLWHLVSTPPFADGNQRTALASALIFLSANGIDLAPNDDLFETLILAIAQGTAQRDQIADALRKAPRA